VAIVKACSALAALTVIVAGLAPGPAGAITVEISRQCQALTTKAFPPRVPGNPAAGSAKGSGRDQIAYFNKCVANAGKVDEEPAKPQSPNEPEQTK
jgi:hypothetical protein